MPTQCPRPLSLSLRSTSLGISSVPTERDSSSISIPTPIFLTPSAEILLRSGWFSAIEDFAIGEETGGQMELSATCGNSFEIFSPSFFSRLSFDSTEGRDFRYFHSRNHCKFSFNSFWRSFKGFYSPSSRLDNFYTSRKCFFFFLFPLRLYLSRLRRWFSSVLRGRGKGASKGSEARYVKVENGRNRKPWTKRASKHSLWRKDNEPVEQGGGGEGEGTSSTKSFHARKL